MDALLRERLTNMCQTIIEESTTNIGECAVKPGMEPKCGSRECESVAKVRKIAQEMQSIMESN